MKKSKKFVIFAWIISIWMIISSALVLYHVFNLQMLPMQILSMVSIIVLLIVVILLLLLHFVSKKTVSRVFSSILVCLFSVVMVIGNLYLIRTNDFISSVSEQKERVKHTVAVYTLKDSKVKKLEKLDNKTVGILKKIDSVGTQKSLKDIKKQDVTIKQKMYDSVQAMVKGLYDKEVDAIILNTSYVSNVTDIEEYKDFRDKTKVVYKTVYYTKDKTDALAVSDITTHPFTIEISGNDAYGDLEEDSRSDVNMLVTVNPNTSTVLLTSIPRDYYIQYACEDNECPVGELDKLTHTGMSGVDTTRDTLSQMLGVDINYIARINFDGAKNIVDALGGVDVNVDKGLSVDKFYTNPDYGVHEGVNHLDGAGALAFARERYAYEDGDKQRVRNQQIVLEALVKKAISTDAVKNYTKLLDAMKGCFQTNMSNEEIKSFIKFQLQANPSWKFEHYVLDGYGDQLYCAASGQDASVLVPDQRTIDIASQKIKAVLNGQSSDTVSDELTGEQTIPDYMANAVSVGMKDDTSEDTSAYQDPSVYQDTGSYADESAYDGSSYDSMDYYDPEQYY